MQAGLHLGPMGTIRAQSRRGIRAPRSGAVDSAGTGPTERARRVAELERRAEELLARAGCPRWPREGSRDDAHLAAGLEGATLFGSAG